MNVIYVADNNYIKYFGPSVVSLFENNRDLAELNVFLLCPDISKENREKIGCLEESYGRTITVQDISEYTDRLDFNAKTNGFNGIITAKLLIAAYLPEHVHEALLLDCDTIVSGSLSELEAIDFNGNLTFAVPELYISPDYKETIGMRKEETYFNSGVMLIDVDAWRREHLADSFLEYYKSKNGELLFADQDVVNHCCRGRIGVLPQKYNLNTNLPYFPMKYMRRIRPEYVYEPESAYKDAISNPAVIHYLGDERPWVKGNFNIYRERFEKYKALSPWNNEPCVQGRELFLFCYHGLNLITRIFPSFRSWFSRNIGMKEFKLIGKN